MPNTFYKYAERQADSYVNWADIGKNMSNMLAETNRVREAKKDALDKSTRDFQEKLNNVPQGQDESARRAALDFADNASKFMYMQDKLLKSGQLSLKDYTVSRQNLIDGTEQAFSAMADYQKVFGEKMDLYKQGKSSLGDVLNMSKVEGFGNWAKSGFYINPTNGQVVVAKKDKKVVDGKEIFTMSESPGEIASINEIKGLIQGKWDKYDVETATDAWAKGLGKDIETVNKLGSLTRTGAIISRDDITNRKDIDEDTKQIMYKFLDAENKWISSILVNDYDQASILLDRVGSADVNGEKVPYFFTSDPEVAKTNNAAILQVIDPSTQQASYKFNEDQEKQSREFIRAIARSKYSKETKITPTAQLRDETYHAPPKTSTQLDAEEKERAAKNFAQNLVYSLTGDENTSDKGTKYLGAKTGLPLQKTKKGYVVTNDKGETQTFNFKADGKTLADPMAFTKSFIGAVNTIGLNEDDVLRYVKQLLPKGAGINLTTESSAYDVKAAPVDPFVVYGNTVNSLIANLSTDEEKAYDDLNSSLQSIGASVRIPYTIGDYIVVKAPNGKESTEINLKDPVKAKSAIEKWLRANPKGENTEKQKSWIKSLQGTGIISGGVDYSTK